MQGSAFLTRDEGVRSEGKLFFKGEISANRGQTLKSCSFGGIKSLLCINNTHNGIEDRRIFFGECSSGR